MRKHSCFIGSNLSDEAGVFVFTVASEIGNLGRLQLKLQFISDQGDELGIRGFSLGIADRVAEKSLQSIQIPTIPGNLIIHL